MPSIRIWEIAGASHVPQAAISQAVGDPRSNLGWLRQREIGPQTPRNCRNPYASHVEVWAVFHAAYAALDRWVTDGVAPAMPTPIQTNGQTAGFWNIVRDANGIALGGLRLPAVEAPLARNDGMNLPGLGSTNPLDGFCILYGTHVPFDAAKLNGISEKLIKSHWENNYGGAVKALNAVEQRLAAMLGETGADVTYEVLHASHGLTDQDLALASTWLARR